MSSSWSTPDPRRTTGLVLQPEHEPARTTRGQVAADVRAGLVAVIASVLVGAPVGLLWAAVAPRVDVVIAAGNANLAMPGTSDFIAADGLFLFTTAVAGLVGGAVAWVLGRRHGPGVVVGLAVGGLLAALVAMRVGQTVNADEVEAFVRAGQQGALELSLRLRAREALVGWPVAALVAYVALSLLRKDRAAVSSG